MARYWTYPDDSQVRTWLCLTWPIAEATWKELDEYKDKEASKEFNRRREALGRGIQQASFRVHDEWQKPELDVDDLMNAVTLFYCAAMEVARFMDEEGNGGVNGEGLRNLAENLLRVSEDWYNAPRQRPPEFVEAAG